MANPRKVTVPINFGRQDKTAPKHAPFGVLKSAKNLRHRELGGLGMRGAYQAQPMSTRNGTLIAYDLHEYQGRLLALGSDVLGETYPADLFEFGNLASERWTSIGGDQRRQHISPFTNARELGGFPLLEGGVQHSDAASGGGYTVIVSRSVTTGITFALVVDSRTNQTITFQNVSTTFGSNVTRERVCFFGGTFYLLGCRTSDNAIRVLSFTPGTSVAWISFLVVDGANAAVVSAVDIVPVGNATTAAFAVAFDRGTSTSLSIKVYNAASTQVGSTISVAGTNSFDIALDADQTDNTIALLETSAATSLRTFNFAGTLLAGPTVCTPAINGSTLARIPGGGSADTAAVGVNDASNNFVIQRFNIDTHAAISTQTVGAFYALTRMVGAAGPTGFSGSFDGLIVGGMYQLQMQLGAAATNALLYIAPVIVHAVTRDYLSGDFQDPTTLTLDTSLGAFCWVATHRTGDGTVRQPAFTLIDFKSTARRQAVNFGGLRYFAGATPWIYDGRLAVESGFQEPPVIESVVTSNGAGFLTPNAKYTYVAHWEYTWADGSYLESPPSLPVNATTGVIDNLATLKVRAPHSLKIALGSSSFGVTAVLVISRTEWSPATPDQVTGLPGAQFSTFRRAVETPVPSGVANYGAQHTVIDTISDTFLADKGAIYTQAERGEFSGSLEHDAPEANTYIAATESRIISGGLVRPFEVQVSKAAFLGQPFAFSVESNFYAQASAPVVGVFSLDTTRLIFTKSEILIIGSNAPDDEGKGAVDDPVRLPVTFGLKDWRSLVEEPGGLWFQTDNDKLFRLPRGGTSPTWDGKDIVDFLAQFPVITAAAKHQADNAVLFACSNSALTSAQIAVRDLLFETWLTDTPPLQASKGIEALAVFGRTTAYLSGGVVYVQSGTSFADNGTTFIDLQLVTNPIYPMGLGGYGHVYEGLLQAEYRGDCIITLSVSYDDGITFTTLENFSLLAANGLTSGATVRKKWTFPQDVTSSVVLKIDVNTAGAPSEGIIINQIDLLAEDGGGLAELKPGDQA